ncbi:unnamed protein product, partial [Closterium sp. NIES-53]
ASESVAALGASESATALGTSESAADLGARASPATGPSSAEALHTFTLDSGASRCFILDYTSLTPLATPVPVSLADPTGGPVVARASTVLPCPAVPSGSRRRPGSSLYTPTTASAQVAEAGQVATSSQVSAFGQLAASCSCWVLSRQNLLWHHRLGHPYLPRLRGMHSRLLVSDLPRSLPSLPHSLAPPCLPCVEGRQRAAPHSCEFSLTSAPLQTLHIDAVVSSVLIPWIRATRCQLRERFSRDFPVLRLHSDRGGEFSYDLLAEFCRDEGIVQSFTLPASPQQNGIAEHHIGLIMEVARTSMIHAVPPHFLWSFAVRYAAHQLNLWPRVSEPETSPTLRWTGKVGDASVFRVWGALSLVRDAKASKLSSRTLSRVFLGFPTDASPWQFYHPPERRVFSSQEVTFDESACYYRLHPHASHPGHAPSGVSQVDPPPLVEPLEISFDSSGPAEGGDPAADDMAATRCSPRLETLPGFPPRPSSQPAAVHSGAEAAGAELGGAETEGEGSGGAASRGAATGGAATRGAGSWGAATRGADSGGPASPSGGGVVGDPTGGKPGGGGYGPAGAGVASPGGTVGAGGTGGTPGAGGAARAGGTRGAAGAGGARATSPRGATGAAGAGPTRAAGPGGTSTGGAGAAGAGGAVRAGGATGASGSGGTGGATGAGGAGAAGAGGTAGARVAGGTTGAAGTGGAGGTAGARGAGAGGTGGAGAAGPGGARTRGTGAAGAGGGAGAVGAGGATGATGTGGAGVTTAARGPGAARASGAAGAVGAGGA